MKCAVDDIIKILRINDATFGTTPINEASDKVRIKTWFNILREYDVEIINPAFKLCLMSIPRAITIADIINKTSEIEKMKEPSDNELWCQLLESLTMRKKNRDRWAVEENFDAGKANRELFHSLNPILKEYLGSFDSWLCFTAENTNNNFTEKNRFFKEIGNARNAIRTKRSFDITRIAISEDNKNLLE